MNANRTYNKALKSNAQSLRKNMTAEEHILWYQFLSKLSVRFYRQRIIGNYIADFYCPKARLVIELGGSRHYDERGLAYDAKRDAFMAENNMTVLRIPNNEVRNNMTGVADMILEYMPKGTGLVCANERTE